MFIVDADGRIVAANLAACQLFGAPERELVGAALSDHAGAGDLQARGPERCYRRSDGAVVLVRELAARIPGAEPPLWVVTLEDTTERQRAAERVRAQTTAAYLGEMSSVVVHEVRNAFAGIRAVVEVIGQDLAPGSEEHEAIAQVRKRMNGLERTLDDVLAFARMRHARLAPVSIRDVLAEVACVLSRRVGSTRLCASGPDLDVEADRELLACALTEIGAVVADAIPHAPIEVSIGRADEQAVVTFGAEGEARAALHEAVLRPLFASAPGAPSLSVARRMLEAQGAELVEDAPAGIAVRIALAASAADH